jgi:hypothetical protein
MRALTNFKGNVKVILPINCVNNLHFCGGILGILTPQSVGFWSFQPQFFTNVSGLLPLFMWYVFS